MWGACICGVCEKLPQNDSGLQGWGSKSVGPGACACVPCLCVQVQQAGIRGVREAVSKGVRLLLVHPPRPRRVQAGAATQLQGLQPGQRRAPAQVQHARTGAGRGSGRSHTAVALAQVQLAHTGAGRAVVVVIQQ